MWCKKAIPTLFHWAVIQGDPWRISESKIAHALTLICNEYFRHSAEYYMITSNCKVLHIISVCTCHHNDLFIFLSGISMTLSWVTQHLHVCCHCHHECIL